MSGGASLCWDVALGGCARRVLGDGGRGRLGVTHTGMAQRGVGRRVHDCGITIGTGLDGHRDGWGNFVPVRG